MSTGEPADGGYDVSQHAWTSKRVLVAPTPPRVVSKRPPEHVSGEADSGWTVGNGDEPALGSDEFEWSPVAELVERFPQLEPVFRAGSGTWRWSTADDRYVGAS
jgi:hypothetical protein